MLRLTKILQRVGFFKHQVSFERSRYLNSRRQRNAVDRGLPTASDSGDAFTEPSRYRNKTNIAVMQNVSNRIARLREENWRNATVSAAGLKDEAIKDIFVRGQIPANAEQEAALDKFERAEFALGERATTGGSKSRSAIRGRPLNGADGHAAREEYTAQLHRLRRRETPIEKQNRIAAKFSLEPTKDEFKKVMKNLLAEEDDEAIVDGIQMRLVEDHALYPAQRLDAYMLGDESIFPGWVHKLSPAVRDRVKYGGMGLTEDDEALRVRLLRMPLDARRAEWARLRAARSYLAGVAEQKLSPRDITMARLAKRRYFWLKARRQARANAIRRLALRQPEKFALLPSQQVDFSARLSTIASFVENGIETKGQWPLDKNELFRAKIRNETSQAEANFLISHSDKAKLKKAKGDIIEALQAMDNDEFKPQKKLSRREYGIRVNNVALGVVDEMGRSYQDLKRQMMTRQKAISEDEKTKAPELESLPQVNGRGRHHRALRRWKGSRSVPMEYKNSIK